MDYENEKQIVSLKDIFFGILYHWKLIVVAMLLGALIMGGLQMYNAPEDPEVAQIKVNNLEKQITVKENAIVNQEDYLRDSYLLSMDPYNLYAVNVSFYIYSDIQSLPQMEFQVLDSSPALLNAYQVLLGDSELIQSISDTVGIESKYVSELLIASMTTGYPGVLTVNITYQDAENATAIAKLVEEFLLNHTENLQKIGKHEVTAMRTISGPQTNQEIVNQQKKANEHLVTLRNELETLKKQHTNLERSLSGASITLMSLIGAGAGAVLAIIVAFLCFMGSSNVYSAQVLSNRTGIKVLGCVPSCRKRNAVTQRLRKAEGRSIDPEDIRISAAIIKNQCANMQKVLIAGKCDQATLTALQENLSELQLFCFENLTNTPEALNALPMCDAVVLVETCAISAYAEIERSIACIADHNKPLIGCILIDG